VRKDPSWTTEINTNDQHCIYIHAPFVCLTPPNATATSTYSVPVWEPFKYLSSRSTCFIPAYRLFPRHHFSTSNQPIIAEFPAVCWIRKFITMSMLAFWLETSSGLAEDEDSMFLWTVRLYLQVHTSQPRRPASTPSQPSEPQTSLQCLPEPHEWIILSQLNPIHTQFFSQADLHNPPILQQQSPKVQHCCLTLGSAPKALLQPTRHADHFMIHLLLGRPSGCFKISNLRCTTGFLL
jgi:hypothetical protein